MVKPKRHLTLFVPGLLGPPSPQPELMSEGMVAPALQSLLSRGAPFDESWADDNLDGMIFQSFGLEASEQGDWPVAVVTHGLDGGVAGKGWYLRADPVHLRANLTTLIPFDADTFSVSKSEADTLAGEINAHYSGEGWAIEVLHPTRWYLHLQVAPRLHTHPLPDVVGKDLRESMPEGPDAGKWCQMLNEIQMILHASSVNQRREARGELPINSLWFWGGGTLPCVPAARWHQVWSDNALILGLARLSKSPRTRAPAHAQVWLEQAVTPGEHLVALDTGYRLCRLADVEGWREYVNALERDWFEPLQRALKRRELENLSILTGSGWGFRVTSSLLRRWWRRRRQLRSFVQPALD